MLDLYYHLHDEDSRQAMMALAEAGESREKEVARCSPFEGNLRATGQSRIEKTLQVPEVQGLVTCLSDMAERVGVDLGRFCKVCIQLSLRLKSADDKDFRRLVDVLFLHDFLPSRDPF